MNVALSSLPAPIFLVGKRYEACEEQPGQGMKDEL